MTTYGVAYWGRGPNRAFKDAERLADAGFSWVNVPISEERMAFDFDGTGQVIAMLRHFGLEVRVSPWGVAGMFGGEGIAGMGGCRAVDRIATVAKWVRQAERLEPDALYWDEPQGAQGAVAVEVACMRATLPQHIYLNPKVGLAPTAGTLDRMASIGIDYYDDDYQRVRDDFAGISGEHGKPVHVWVQAFRLESGLSFRPGEQIRELEHIGVDDIAIWGYPSPGVSCLNNARPRKVWRAITDAMEATCCSSS